MGLDGFHDRLRQAIGDLQPRQVADITGLNPETIRRVIAGGAPTTEFVQTVCATMDISADWLLLGRGPMLATDVRRETLARIPAEDLVGSLVVHLRHSLQRPWATPDTERSATEPR